MKQNAIKLLSINTCVSQLHFTQATLTETSLSFKQLSLSSNSFTLKHKSHSNNSHSSKIIMQTIVKVLHTSYTFKHISMQHHMLCKSSEKPIEKLKTHTL